MDYFDWLDKFEVDIWTAWNESLACYDTDLEDFEEQLYEKYKENGMDAFKVLPEQESLNGG